MSEGVCAGVIGCDAALGDVHGRCVSEEVYEGRGKLVFGKKFRISDLPGIWASGETFRHRQTGSLVEIRNADCLKRRAKHRCACVDYVVQSKCRLPTTPVDVNWRVFYSFFRFSLPRDPLP